MPNETNKPETLAAILAEMRKTAKDSYAEKTAKRLEGHEATGTRDALDIKDAIQCLRDDDKYLLDLADRIEAAARREREPGNAAATRGALEELVYRKCLVQGSCGKPMDKLCTYTACIWHPYRAALAVPARNCDVVRNEDEALSRCRESVAVERDAAYDRGMRDAIRWLLAPAKKGGEK